MIKSFLLAAAVLVGSPSCADWSHYDTMELRASGIVAVTGGALLFVTPELNGDHLGTATTVAGSALLAAGVAMIVAAFHYDPGQPAKTSH